MIRGRIRYQGMAENKRPCPNFDRCGQYRKTGEIFCHKCYFRLPKELRDLLWGRNLKAIEHVIEQGKVWLAENPEEGGA